MTIDSSEHRRVLVVDDDQKMLDLLVELLQQEQYEVASTRDGPSALVLIASFEPDVVVSDVVMPCMNGIELCRQLKQDARTTHIPVLLISGLRKSDEDSLEGLTAGADDYLDVPFSHQEFLVKVARLTERHRVEKHYRDIVEQAPDIIYTRDLDGYVTSINEAGAQFFGRSAAQLVGANLRELIGADMSIKDIEATSRSTSDSPLRSIHCLKDARGKQRYLEGLVTVERDTRNEPIGVRGVVRDITEHKTTEQALKDSEERYRQLVEFSPNAIVVHREGSFVYVNPAAQKLWGASSPDELLGKPILDLVHPDYRDLVERRVRRVENEGVPSPPCEEKFLTLDGRVIDVEVKGMPFSFNGEPAIQVVIADITERKRAEEERRQSENGYRELFENANDIIYTHDLEGNFTSLNMAGERVTGYTREEAMRMKISDVLVPESLALARQVMSSKTINRAPTVYELEIVAKDGRRVQLELSTRLIYKDKKAVGVQGIGRDLTERKRAEAEILQRNQELAALNEVGQALSKLAEPAEIAKLIHTMIGKVLDNQNLYVALYDEETQELSFPAYTIDGKPHYSPPRMLGQGLTDYIIRTKKPLLVPRYVQERFDQLGLVSMGRPCQCWLAVPMLVGEKAVGVITIQDYEKPEVYNIRHLELLSTIAAQAAIAVENARLYAEMKHRAEREAIINRISQEVRRSLNVTEVFETAVRELGTHLEVDRCSLFMKDEKAGLVINAAEYLGPGIQPAGRDFDVYQLQDLIAAGEEHGVLPFDDASDDERIHELYEHILRPAGVRSIIYVAIRVGNEVPAAFALSTTQRVRHWSETDIAMAKVVADHTGIAIRKAQLYQKAETTSTRETLANKLSRAIRASLSLSEVLKTATHELGGALAASHVHLCLYDPEHPVSPVEHEYVAPGYSSISHVDVSYDDPIGQHLRNNSKPIVIGDALTYSEGPPEFSAHVRSQAGKLGLRSQIDYPLIVKGVFRGALCINQTDRVRYWTEDELALVESVAAQLATGIAQAELFEMVARGKQEWETTFDAMSDGIFIFDRAGRLKRVNRAGAGMEKATPQDLLGRRCCDILRTSAEDESCVVEKALAEGGSVTIEVTPERLNRPLLVTIEAVLDNSNRPAAVVCTARDLSELRKVEAVAREHQSLLTNILESARESIYAVDTQGRFKWCNSATLRGLGYQREDFIGRHLLEMIYEGDRELVSNKLAGALKGEPQTCEFRYFARDGKVRYTRVDKSPLVVDGRTTGVLGIARDITEQKEERERAARADKLRALGQLASGVAHDFNNSLAAILGRAQLLHRQTKDPALLRNVEIIQTAAQDAAATVRRIQTFARKSSAREFELVDVRSLLNDAIEITRTRWYNEARLRGLNYEIKLEAENVLPANGTASELREVFVNLIVNAVDAMPQGGCLAISCARKDDRLELNFADSGGGMSEDVREKVFEPFFSTKGAQGTGLGLSVSYSIIERHGGSIKVDSEVGRGTTFTIELPATERRARGIEELVAAPESAPLSILVVDDEPSVRETLADMLGALNHKVVLADSGHAALEKLATGDFDLVFTDLAMPEMDGWETARAIRRRGCETNIVLVTGYGAGTVAPPGETGLINAILGKPFDFDQVGEVITRLSPLRNRESLSEP